MPKVKFTLDGTRGLIQELVPDDNVSELTVNNLDRSVYARKDYVDNAISNISGSGGSISLTGSNVFGSLSLDTHQFTGSVFIDKDITLANGTLIGTASFASNADKLDSLDSTAFARLASSNTFTSTNTFSGANTIISSTTSSFTGRNTNFTGTNINFLKLDQTSSVGYIHAIGEITSSLRVSAPSLTGSLLGTASFASNSDLLDGLDSTTFARLDTNNTFSGNQVLSGTVTIASVGGNEGGQIDLGLAVTNQNLTGTVALDIFQNKFRVFETGGNNRGATIDISNMSSSVGSNIVTSTEISSIVTMTSASYATITPVSGTLYIILG